MKSYFDLRHECHAVYSVKISNVGWSSSELSQTMLSSIFIWKKLSIPLTWKFVDTPKNVYEWFSIDDIIKFDLASFLCNHLNSWICHLNIRIISLLYFAHMVLLFACCFAASSEIRAPEDGSQTSPIGYPVGWAYY